MKMAIQIEVEAAKENFFAKNSDEKLAKICLMKSFIERIVRNGIFYSQNAMWRKFLEVGKFIEKVKARRGNKNKIF